MPITRRDFIKSAGVLSATPLMPLTLTLPRMAGASDGGYKAMICVFLFGGNDSFNMVLPYGGQHYDDYRAARPDIAHDQSVMLDLGLTSSNGVPMALHPNMSRTAQLIKNGHAAALINVGTLRQPTSKSNVYSVPKPPNLGAHNKQQLAWQHSWETSAYHPYGWAGMMMDLLGNPDLLISESMSFGGNEWLGGQFSKDARMTSSEIPSVLPMTHSSTINTNIRELVTATYESPFATEYLTRLDEMIAFKDKIDASLGSYPEDESIPDSSLGKQLRMVKRMMQASADFGHQRQVFFVSMGGFDNHKYQKGKHDGLMKTLDDALGGFYDALASAGLQEQAVTFTMSDFGRTIQNNGNKGTDHGWGSNQLVLGGPVAGGQAYGNFPEFIRDGNDAYGNKFIPGQAHEQMAATLGKWFGLSDSQVDGIFPILRPTNSNPFSSRYLGFMKGAVMKLTPVSAHATVQKPENPASDAIDGNILNQ